jgi:hypothetical protein
MKGLTKGLRTAALLSGALLAHGAAAADQTPSLREDALARRAITEFARCVADRQPEIAQDYVTDPGKWLEEDDWKKLVDIRCVPVRGGELRTKLWMDSFAFRGALAQRLIVKRLDEAALGDLAGIPPLAWPEDATQPGPENAAGDEPDKLQAAYTRGVVQSYVSRLGECIVRRDPAGVRPLFDTDVDGQRERQALAAIAPAISACVAPGEQVRVDRYALRAALATSYFRLAAALGARAAGANS